MTITDAKGCLLSLEIFAGTIGTTQLTVISSISLFPNPSSGQPLISVYTEHPIGLEVLVFNQLGQEVYSKSSLERRTRHVLPLELMELRPGLYFVQTRLDNGETKYFD